LAATQPTIPPAVLPQVQPAALPVAPVFGPAIVPPKPIPPTAESAPVASPQIQAIQGALGGLGKQAEELQIGLKGLMAQQVSEEPLRKAEEAIIAAQRITPEEQTAEQQLSNLIASRELGLQAVSEKPIAMPFIVGQQQAIERRAAVQTMPLQARLAQLQSKRMSSLDVGKSQLEIEKGRQIRAEKIKKEARPDETEISEFVNAEGNRIVVFKNNKTGKLRQEIVGKEKIGIDGKTVGDKITPTTKANIQTTLFNVGIPISVSTDKGELNKSYYDKAISAGLAPKAALDIGTPRYSTDTHWDSCTARHSNNAATARR